MDGLHDYGSKGIRGREDYADGHVLLVEGVGGGKFVSAGGNFDSERGISGVLSGEPRRDSGELGSDDRGGYVFFCPCLDRLLKLARTSVSPPDLGEGRQILETEEVDVNDKGGSVSFWQIIVIGAVVLGVVARAVDRLGSGADEVVERHREKVVEIGAFFYRGYILTLELVGCIAPVIENQDPAKEIAIEMQW